MASGLHGIGFGATVPRRRGIGALGARRQVVVSVLAVLVVLSAFVLADRTTQATPNYRRGAVTQYLSTVSADALGCSDGLHDAVQAAQAQLSGARDIAAGVASTFTQQAMAACSFTSERVASLLSLQPPPAISSPPVAAVAPAATNWAFPAAFSYLQRLRAVLAHPSDAAAHRRLAAAASTLAKQYGAVQRAVAAAERYYHLRPRALHLARSAPLPPPSRHRGGSGRGA